MHLHTAILSPQQYLAEEHMRTGASWIHNLIASNLHVLLVALLREKGFFVSQSDLRVSDPLSSSYLYPDLVLIRGKAAFLDSEMDTLINPFIVIEILSPSSESYDRGEKFEVYRQIPSLQEYVLVSQKKALIESFYRNDAGRWELSSENQLTSVMHLRSAEVEISLSEVYRGVFE